MERLTEYQAELTADMLIMGVLKHDDEPSGQEMEDVDMEKLRKKLKKGKALPDGFETECAKLRRYSYWDGKMFMIDFEQFVNYIIRVYSLLTCEQRKAMYEYKVQMTQIHEDMRKLMKEHEEDELKEEKEMKEKATEETQRVYNDKVQKLKPLFYNNEDNVKRFLKEIDSMPPNNITDLVNQWVKDKLISDYGNSRKGELWDILNKAGLYTKSRQNWNRRVF